MRVRELQDTLRKHPETFPRFILPNGEIVPAHYHVTEVGHVVRNFIDCGGKTGKRETAVLQCWFSESDPEHRLRSAKFADILSLGDRVLPADNLDVEVEYDCCVISQYPINRVTQAGDHLDFYLAGNHTDCLAPKRRAEIPGGDTTQGVSCC